MIKIPTLKEYCQQRIDELPIAVLGDWGGNSKFKEVTTKREKEIQDKWKLEDTLKVKEHELEIYSYDNDYIIGVWGV